MEPVVVHEATRLAALYEAGSYEPAWLWSLYASVELAEGVSVEIGGQFIYPEPIATPQNCPECTSQVRTHLWGVDSANLHRSAVDLPSCVCLASWLEAIGDLSTGLREHLPA